MTDDHRGMGLKISAILINRVLPEDEQTALVQKYYRSYSPKGEAKLEEALHPDGRDMFVGSVGIATILTHSDIPYNITLDARNVGVYEKKHPLLSKLTKHFPTEDLFCCYFNSVGVYFSYSFIRDGLRVRYKRSHQPDNLAVEEAGDLQQQEIPYHAFSRILSIEPSGEQVYPSGARLHTSVIAQREYHKQASLTSETPEFLNEFQVGYEVIMDVSQSFLGTRLDRLPMEQIPMTRYAK